MFNLQRASDYLRYRFQAKNRHGVHSPFVYKLVDQVIYDFGPKNDYYHLDQFRRLFSKDEKTIMISNRYQENKKQMDLIRRKGRSARLIYRLANYFSPNQILEIGSSFGINACYLAKSCPEAAIMNMDANLHATQIAFNNLKKQRIKNVTVLHGDLDKTLPQVIHHDFEFLDFLLINPGYSKESILNYFNQCLPKMTDTSITILEGIYQNKEAKETWQAIKGNQNVTITIDLFSMGLIFTRRQQAKEHFRILF